MPLPKPKSEEKKKEFLSRCMGDDIMVKEYKNQSQRYAICLTQWSRRKKSKSGELPSWDDARKDDTLILL